MPSLTHQLQNKIAWKIYSIWFVRRIVPLIALQVLALALALKIFSRNVFVAMVLKNIGQVAERGYWEVLKYMVASFLATKPLTQITIFVLFGVIALILRDAARALASFKLMRMRRR